MNPNDLGINTALPGMICGGLPLTKDFIGHFCLILSENQGSYRVLSRGQKGMKAFILPKSKVIPLYGFTPRLDEAA